MLERNWRNNRLFCHIFVIGEISIWGTPAPSPCLRLCSKWGKQKRCSQIFREVSGVFQQNFNASKICAVLEPSTGQFSRTWGFEAKAKAKDFKMCPWGQRRPRGLHLRLIDFGLEESAVGERTVTFVLSQFVKIGTKHARRCREPSITS